MEQEIENYRKNNNINPIMVICGHVVYQHTTKQYNHIRDIERKYKNIERKERYELKYQKLSS